MDQNLRADWAGGALLGLLAGLFSLAASRPQTFWPVVFIALVPLGWWIVAGSERWVLAFLISAVLLPPLPLPWGNAGVHPGVLFAGLGIGAGIVRLPGWRVRASFLSATLTLVMFVLLLSVPLAALYSGWEIALGSLARVGLFGISVYLFFYVAYGPGRELQPERLIRTLFWAALASAGFACLDFYFQLPAPARFAEQYVWLSSAILRRAQGVFYEATTFGVFCVFFLILIAAIVALRLQTRLRLSAPWLLAATLLFLGGLAFSFSRSATGGWIVALAALGWLERERLRTAVRFLRRLLPGLALLLACAGLVSRLFPEFLSQYFDRLWYSGQFLFSAPDVILAPRLESWRFLLDWIAQNPWHSLFGIGYKTLPYSEFLGRTVVADNMYISLLVETGWMGLLAVLLLHAAVLTTCYRRAAALPLDPEAQLRRLCAVCVFCFWCGQLVQMLSSDILTYWRLLPLSFCLLAMLEQRA
jgi:O-antigen ligase